MTSLGVRTKPSACPYCGKINDAATHPADPKLNPKPGDLGMCVGCGGFLRYGKNMQLEKFTHDELVDLDPSVRKQLTNAHSAWTMMRGSK